MFYSCKKFVKEPENKIIIIQEKAKNENGSFKIATNVFHTNQIFKLGMYGRVYG